MSIDLNEKPSNPKDQWGSTKIPFHLWPQTATLQGVIAMLEGGVKYGRSNYRAVGVRSSIYYDAALRHIISWFEGEDLTSDAGVAHLGNALACLAILVDAKAAGILVDDRMYPGGYHKLLAELTPMVKKLQDMYKGKKPHHYSRLDVTNGKVTEDSTIIPVSQMPSKFQGMLVGSVSRRKATRKSRKISSSKGITNPKSAHR